jgi:hypothetical protein
MEPAIIQSKNRGIAVHTMVLIIMVGFFALVSFFIFYKWAAPMEIETTVASCTFKKASYCTDWAVNDYRVGGEPWNWYDKEPKNCESVGISKPQDKDDCKI